MQKLVALLATAGAAAWAKKKMDQQRAAQATWGSATDPVRTPTSGTGPAGTGLGS